MTTIKCNYIDDIFCILRKGTAEKLLNHLKRIQPTIKFTMELEEVGPFLSWTLWWEGGRMEVWTLLSTKDPHTQMGTLISNPSPHEERYGGVSP